MSRYEQEGNGAWREKPAAQAEEISERSERVSAGLETGTEADGRLPMTFSFGERAVRTVLNGGETWFVATDVCDILEHTDASKAVARLDADERVSLMFGPLAASRR